MVTKHAKIQFIKESPDQREQDQTKKEFLAHHACNQFNSGVHKAAEIDRWTLSGEPKEITYCESKQLWCSQRKITCDHI